MNKVCFFSRVPDVRYFEICEFYNNDIKILTELGFDVLLCNRIKELPVHVDWYYSWFYGWSMFPALLAKMMDKPHVVCGNIHTESCGGLSQWPYIKRMMMKSTMKLSDVSIFTSKLEIERLDGFVPNEVSLLSHGINMDIYHGGGLEHRNKNIISITHLTKESIKRKRIIDCLHAFAYTVAKVPQAHYFIAGSYGDGVDMVKQTIAKLSLERNVTLTGRISQDEKIEFLQFSRIYLQPSYCEGFGLALVEAQACRLPVITSEESCIREINGDAVLYANAIDEMKEYMVMLLSNDEFWKKRSQQSVNNALNYTYNERKQGLRDVLKSCKILSA